MKAIVVTDKAAETAGMTLAQRPEPNAVENDVVVQVHASGFTPGELTWPGTWTDRFGRDRTNNGRVASLDDAVAAFNPTGRVKGKTTIRVRP